MHEIFLLFFSKIHSKNSVISYQWLKKYLSRSPVLQAIGFFPIFHHADEDDCQYIVRLFHEEIFLHQSEQPILLEEGAPALRVLQYVRNESHRFATGFHKKLRAKRLDKLMLEDIKGIGKKRSRTLLRVFGSLEEIMKSSPEDLAKKAFIPMSASRALIRHLKEKFETNGLLPPTG